MVIIFRSSFKCSILINSTFTSLEALTYHSITSNACSIDLSVIYRPRVLSLFSPRLGGLFDLSCTFLLPVLITGDFYLGW